MPRPVPEGLCENPTLSRYTTMRVGGPARYLAQVDDATRLLNLAHWAESEGLDWVVLGEGSNVIVADGGYDGLVIVYRNADVEPVHQVGAPDEERPELEVEASMPLSNLARWTARRGQSGLEWAAGLPGTVGGALVGNAGAFGGCIGDVLTYAAVVRSVGITRESAETLGLGYRRSALSRTDGRLAVLRVGLRLRRDDASACLARLEEAVEARRRSQPGGSSSGCVFRNPSEGSAGQLLDLCGFKGMTVGDAVVSEKHANFIINRGSASAADVVKLMQVGREVVRRRFGVVLEPEVRLIGDLSLGEPT